MKVTETAVVSIQRHSLPPKVNGSLWSGRPSCGEFDFRGRRLRIEVPDPGAVLFPTDCGLSLLAALQTCEEPQLAGRRVFDVGCGSGLYTVAMLAAGASHVTASDINAAALPVAHANVVGNGLDPTSLTCVTADLADYRPAEKFDVVITNPPHLPYDPAYRRADGLESALVAGHDGRGLYDVVVDRIDHLLEPGGTLLMAHSSLADVGRTTTELERQGYSARTLGVFEMDIPLLAYTEHKETMLRRLKQLREAGKAVFDNDRFFVHALAFTRA